MILPCLVATAILLSFPADRVEWFQQKQGSGESSSTAATPPADSQKPSPAQPSSVPAKASSEPGSTNKSGSSATKSGKRHSQQNAGPAKTGGAPRRVVIREGGVSEPSAQLVPGMAPEEASRRRESTEDLLVSTENLLKRLAGRSLDASQQETVGQIRNYLEGARSALKDGDTPRAHTLALKAYLLSDDLVQH